MKLREGECYKRELCLHYLGYRMEQTIIDHQRDATIHQRIDGKFSMAPYFLGASTNNFICSLNRLPSGKLLLIYDSAHSLKKGYSTDGGEIWTEPELVNNDPTVNDVSGGITPSGRVVIFYAKGETAQEAHTEHGFIYSDDEGTTWSDYQSLKVENPISGIWDYNRPYGRMIEIGNGILLQGLWCFTSSPPSYNVYVLFSNDNGTSWGEGVIVHRDVVNADEASFIHLGGRKIMAVNMAHHFLLGIKQYLSEDNGLNWSEVGTIPTTGAPRTAVLIGQKIGGGEFMVALYYTTPSSILPYQGDMYRTYGDVSEVYNSINGWSSHEKVTVGVYAYPSVININDGLEVLGIVPNRGEGVHTALKMFIDRRK